VALDDDTTVPDAEAGDSGRGRAPGAPAADGALFGAAPAQPPAPGRRPAAPKAERPSAPTEVRSIRDIPFGCLCRWDSFRKGSGSRAQRWFRLVEVHPGCDSHATPQQQADVMRGVEAGLARAAERCCGVALVLDGTSAGRVFECPACGRPWKLMGDVFERHENPLVLPSERLAAARRAGVPAPAGVLSGELEAIAENRLF
jgi:hypothetical protein